MSKALVLAADGFEDVELLYPYYRMIEAGFETVVAAPKSGEIEGKHGYRVKVDLTISEVNPEDYEVLIIPGGRAPERVRLVKEALDIVRAFFREEKPVAVICHGPQVLISAGLVKGRRLTSWWGIKDDIIAAGGIWADEPVIVDGNLVSSRYPGDIPLWMREFIRLLDKRRLLKPTPQPS